MIPRKLLVGALVVIPLSRGGKRERRGCPCNRGNSYHEVVIIILLEIIVFNTANSLVPIFIDKVFKTICWMETNDSIFHASLLLCSIFPWNIVEHSLDMKGWKRNWNGAIRATATTCSTTTTTTWKTKIRWERRKERKEEEMKEGMKTSMKKSVPEASYWRAGSFAATVTGEVFAFFDTPTMDSSLFFQGKWWSKFHKSVEVLNGKNEKKKHLYCRGNKIWSLFK